MPAGYPCPVCDYPKLSEPPRSEFGGGSFEICPSCGFQFGVNDDDEGISYETWRRRWEAAGMPWNSLALKQPASWNPVAKHVAPGGAALRRPGDPPEPVAIPESKEEKPSTRGPEPARVKPTASKTDAANPVKKSAAKSAVAAKSKKPAKPAAPAKSAKKSAPAKKSSRG